MNRWSMFVCLGFLSLSVSCKERNFGEGEVTDSNVPAYYICKILGKDKTIQLYFYAYSVVDKASKACNTEMRNRLPPKGNAANWELNWLKKLPSDWQKCDLLASGGSLPCQGAPVASPTATPSESQGKPSNGGTSNKVGYVCRLIRSDNTNIKLYYTDRPFDTAKDACNAEWKQARSKSQRNSPDWPNNWVLDYAESLPAGWETSKLP